jgi:DNA-binding response OmpR family regulator
MIDRKTSTTKYQPAGNHKTSTTTHKWSNGGCNMSRSLLNILFCYGLLYPRGIVDAKSMVALAFSGTAQNFASGSSRKQNNQMTWILLAEEEQSMRNKIGNYLADEGGFVVTGVADAKSALLVSRGSVRPKKIANIVSDSTKHPDCLVLGAHLPGSIDGLDLLKIIRSDSSMQFLPVIVLAERGHDRLEGYDAGADAYISKPFDLEELLSVIGGLLKRRTTSSQKEETTSQRSLTTIKARELRQELAEIKSLLAESGLITKDVSNNTKRKDASIQHDLAEIKQAILHRIDKTNMDDLGLNDEGSDASQGEF